MPSPIPSNVKNKALYQKIKDEIHATDAAAGRQWGKHSSDRLVSTYLKRGGKYSGKKPAYKSPIKKKNPRGRGGLRQWDDEKWLDQYGRPCGSGKKGEIVKCRPSVRVNKDTPVTWKELSSKGEKNKVIRDKFKVGMGKRAPTIKKRSPTKSPKRSPKKTSKKSPKGSLKRSPKRSPKKMEGGVKVGKYYYKKSTRPGFKLMTVVDGKTIHFGKPGYEQYKDKTGIWASENHGDKERRKNYLTRAGGIRDKEGNLTKNDPKKANYHAMKVLW